MKEEGEFSADLLLFNSSYSSRVQDNNKSDTKNQNLLTEYDINHRSEGRTI